MEIKIQCGCGCLYRFDVEPVEGRMPATVKCPQCGADGTEAANQQIQFASGGTSPSRQPPPPISAPAPAPLQVHRPSAPPVLSAPPTLTAIRRAQPKATASKIIGIVVGVIVLCVIGAGYLLHELLPGFRDLVKNDESASKEESGLDFDNCLFVHHTNNAEVAEACREFWDTTLHKRLAVSGPTNAEAVDGVENAYLVWPSRDGYIWVSGNLVSVENEHDRLAAFLSKKFAGPVFQTRCGDFWLRPRFSVYDQGERKFNAQWHRTRDGDDAEPVKTEGNDWAMTNGYHGGATGIREFGMDDAETITKHFGAKSWDSDSEEADSRNDIYMMVEQP